MNFDLARRRAELTPERPALWWRGAWRSYADLERGAESLAARLQQAGVERGARVSILAHNHLAHIELILATAKTGIVYTPFNRRLAAAELRDIAGALRPALLLSDSDHAGAAGATGVPLAPLEDYGSWRGTGRLPGSPPGVRPEEIQMILPTGGTTGVPKGACLPYRMGWHNAVATVLSWQLRDDDCAIQATPCFHAAVNALTLPLLHLGGRVVLQERFDPGEYLRLVEACGATLLFMVPTMYQQLIACPEFAAADLSGVRWAISGGAPCPEPVRRAFLERGVRFRQGYGLTEAGVNCFAIDLDTAAERPDAVGRPLIGTDAVVRRPDGSPAGAGEIGELTLSGPHLFAGYFERPEATAAALRNGWLWTGDLAVCDGEGLFRIVGRRKEMFISGGENVYPAEIETALYDHPLVAECAVLGVSDPHWGEVGYAAVVLRESGERRGDPAAELRRFLRERLAGYKLPRHLHFVEALPKSGAGKILKTELKRVFEARAARESAPRNGEGEDHAQDRG